MEDRLHLGLGWAELHRALCRDALYARKREDASAGFDGIDIMDACPRPGRGSGAWHDQDWIGI